MNWNDQEAAYRDSREFGTVVYYPPTFASHPMQLATLPRDIIGYCISFETGEPHNCGCGGCEAAAAAGLAVGETMEVTL